MDGGVRVEPRAAAVEHVRSVVGLVGIFDAGPRGDSDCRRARRFIDSDGLHRPVGAAHRLGDSASEAAREAAQNGGGEGLDEVRPRVGGVHQLP